MARPFSNRTSTKLWGPVIAQTRGEIDMRAEMHEILFGSNSKPQRGHWVVYRRFDMTTKATTFDEVYREGVGGPSNVYTDTIVMTRRDPILAPEENEAHTPIGLLEGGKNIYYFEYDFLPRISDQIFEVNWADHTRKPLLSQLAEPHLEKYNIKEVFPYRCDAGRIEHWIVATNKDKINY